MVFSLRFFSHAHAFPADSRSKSGAAKAKTTQSPDNHPLAIYPALSYEQVPQDEGRAKGACRPEHHLRCAPPLCCSLQLLIPAAYILGCVERILHKLLNMRCLYAEIVCKRRLKFRDLGEGLFGCAGMLG